jgi:hypothetical protein
LDNYLPKEDKTKRVNMYIYEALHSISNIECS